MQHWLDYKRENSRTYSRAFISNMYKKKKRSKYVPGNCGQRELFLLF